MTKPRKTKKTQDYIIIAEATALYETPNLWRRIRDVWNPRPAVTPKAINDAIHKVAGDKAPVCIPSTEGLKFYYWGQ